MKQIDQLIIVESDYRKVSDTVKEIVETGFSENVKVAVNGEHALLCLDHLDLYKRIKGKKTMIILNIDTPVVNGLSFLNSFKSRNYFSDEIYIVVTDNTGRENIEKAYSLGVKNVVSTPLKTSEIIELGADYFGEGGNKEKKTKIRKPETQRISA